MNGGAYSVISFNPFKKPTQPEWQDKSVLIAGCTSSGAEVSAKVGTLPPSENQFKSGDYQPVRKAGVVEKCIFCHHRTMHGLQPACVDACPADARIFGDLNDPKSAVALALQKYKSMRLKVEEGTEPNVFYVRSYNDPTV
jgi:Fe-S-cluster-containing dehydrogenase component